MTTAHSVAHERLMHDIPVTARPDMRVPARVFADDELWLQISGDRSLEQLMNVATLPGITRFAYGMPDMHEGYGFPVGGVAALRATGRRHLARRGRLRHQLRRAAPRLEPFSGRRTSPNAGPGARAVAQHSRLGPAVEAGFR